MFGRKKNKNSELELQEAAEAATSTRTFVKSPNDAIKPEPAPPPPEKTRKNKSSIVAFCNALLTLFVVALLIAAGVFFIGKYQFDSPGPLKQTRTVIIAQGTNVNSIAERLFRNGVISDQHLFIAGVFLTKSAGNLKAGEYLFPQNVSMSEVLDTLTKGRSILHRVTIPEGRTSQQVVDILLKDPTLTGEITEIPPEGSLLPETYSFTRGATRKSIIERMQRDMQVTLNRVWERRNKSLPISTPEELVILASIVEKETGRADERPRVASVFVNRLNRSMRLQSDPTIIYGIVGGKGSLGRPIRRSEINQKTDYNTYQIDGLPPGPIANPGRASLEATANPSITNDLFFVADGTGGHAFAETLDEHNRNVREWRKIEAQRAKDRQNQPAATPGEDEEQTPPSTLLLPPSPLILDLNRPTN